MICEEGHPGRLLSAARRRAFTLTTSPAQIDEFCRVLSYPRLQRFIHPAQGATLLSTIDAVAEVIHDQLPPIDVSNDVDDNLILATAVAGRADLLVTGDKGDLLGLVEFQGIPIVSPADAVARMSNQ